MKKILPVLLILFLFQYSFSQQKVMDSLEHVLSQIKQDSLVTKEFSRITQGFRRGNQESHLYFTKKYIEHSQKINDDKVKGFSIRELAIYYTNGEQLDSALVYCDKAIGYFEKASYAYGVCITKNSKAIIYQDQGDYLKAIKNYTDVISHLETLGDKMALNVLYTKMNIGTLYGDMNDVEKQEEYNLLVYKDPLTKKTKSLLSSICINLALGYRSKGLLDEALKYALEANEIETRPKSLANVKSSLAKIYSKKKEYKIANVYYKEALAICESNNLLSRVNYIHHNIAYNYLDWGKYKEAEFYFLKANKSIDNHESVIRRRKGYQGLSELYYAKEDYKNSLKYFKKERDVSDSLRDIEKQKAVSNFEIKYDTEKTRREKEVAEQQVAITKLESQKNRNLFVGSLVVGSLILLTSVFYFNKLKAKKKAELITIELQETQKRLAIEKQYRDSELKALKAQMNPHFIFNALNSIQDYIVLNKKNLASDYLGKFADLIRNYLHFSDTGFISIPEEVHNLNLYLELEKLRFEEQLEYTFEVDEAANSDEIYIPTMLIQPYVENALKHGLLHKKENRRLKVSMGKPSDKIIECIIEDNGIGREKSREINKKREGQHKSFALKATTERLDLLNYGREKKIGVEIIDLQESNEAIGTKVILKIPIIKK